MQIIMSTHAVLANALSHRFIEMWKLALLIFNKGKLLLQFPQHYSLMSQAHHYAQGHPANKIMRDFYHPTIREQGRHGVPHILGLTASPIIRSKLSKLPFVPIPY
jgi:hypothetical protein